MLPIVRSLKLVIYTLLVSASLQAMAEQQCWVIDNIHGYTPTRNSLDLTEFNWLAFSEGKTLNIGRNEIPQIYQACTRIEGKNQFLLPGFIDAHGHVLGLGTEFVRVQLRGVASQQKAVERVLAFSKENPKAKWLLGRGWNQVGWPGKKLPSRRSLDKTGIKKPIVLRRIDGHAAWVNSVALECAGIDKSTPDPQGGKIVRDKKGDATGVLIDNAIALVEQKIPPPSQRDIDYAFDKAFNHLLSVGLVSVHDAGVSQLGLNNYLKRVQQQRLPVRIYGMLSGSSPNLDQWLKDGIYNDNADFLAIRSVKLYADGALGSRGAALLEPYSDDINNRGLLLTSPVELEKLMAQIIENGFQVNVHAIGDHGNRMVLNAFEKVFRTSNGRRLRNRIEHAQVVNLKDIPRFKSLDIIPSMQPVHATSDKNMAGDRLGGLRLSGAYAWQKFLQQGSPIAAGSDFPVEYANPFYGIHAAVTRQDHKNEPKGGWLPKDRMTPAQALRSFTLDAAYAAHQEKMLGSLEKGKWADFIMVDQDIINGDPTQIWKTRVLATWIAGKQVYRLQKQ